MGIRSQYSIEFILVFAFSLVIIIPLVNIMHSEYGQSKETLDQAQAKQILDEISIAVYNAYYAGYPSRTTLDLYFPKGILRINVTNVMIASGTKTELVFVTKTGSNENSMVAVFPFKVNSSIQISEGRKKILVKAEKQSYVNITDFPD